MSSIEQTLQRKYDLFIQRDKELDFFKGLADYLDYVIKTPSLKKVFDDYLAENY